jgi:hypothetical protein
MSGRSSNAQSTAYAVQGLLAMHAAGAAVSRALAYLSRLQRRNGSIAYSSTSSQTPVWVTAQALAALRRTPLPIVAVARVRREPRHTPREGAASAAPGDRAAPTTSKEGSTGAGSGHDSPKQSGASTGALEGRSVAPSGADAVTPATPMGPAPRSAGPAAAPATRTARVEGEGGGEVSTWLVIAAIAVVLGLSLLLRRRPLASRFAAS